ncbi:MAG TPA: GPO family capsid scaffolding protein [Candidatus Thiothrix moscowensis]|uniref:GPO family capsid scaffolding protein n=1 Tax=unclassified Thiothrix TaxID=2636184 RepID=UPI0025D2EC17|nr:MULTISPECIES: GPO family capsid scaffolding protein [unclassified Thiothrix]HRJ51269.1 GPO family capsid scaffolding protein [Candidatus Thiothrix moscowensis]HRJ91676.1 GPO family capsid scaffolding protein [Candidatus Thiothrix moscowensis]
MKLTTDFIRAAVEGITADGREITASQIEQMAASYSQDTYNARIWPEHIRGIMPDGLFKALGDVVAAKAERIKEGELAGKMALYVQLEPHPDLITMVRSGQKVHLSIEMHPQFPNTNGAYLMGLGVTDSPASLGTGVMKFSTSSRGESVFTEPQELATTVEPFDTAGQPEHFSKMVNYFTTEINRLRAERDEIKAAYAKLKADTDAEIDDLKGQIPAAGYKFRPLTTGTELEGELKGWR